MTRSQDRPHEGQPQAPRRVVEPPEPDLRGWGCRPPRALLVMDLRFVLRLEALDRAVAVR